VSSLDPGLEWLRLSEHYRQMTDGELLALASQKADLTEAAQQAIQFELSQRRLTEWRRQRRQVDTGERVDERMPIAEVLTATQWHIEQLAGAAGMKIIQQIIQDDVRQFASWREVS
jgi:hypothetical protein